MTIASVKPGDLVLADVRGERFYAAVEQKAGRELEVRTLIQHRPRILTARQVVAHWRRAGSRRAAS